MGKILVGAVVGGIVMFIWGMISWMVLPWHNSVMHGLPGEDAVVKTLAASNPDEGMYFFPIWPTDREDEEGMKAFEKKHEAGPTGVIVYQPEGSKMMDPMVFVKGLGLNVAGALLASLVVAGAGAIGFGRRAIMVALLGLFAAITTHGMYWNYMKFPADWTVVMIVDQVIGWTLAGFAIAKIVKPAQ